MAKEKMAKGKKLAEAKEQESGNEPGKDRVAKPVDPYGIIKYPLSTEKSIRQIEFDNKIVFAVHPQATKRDVKKAVEELFKVQVAKVNIQNSFRGIKKAYVKLGPASLASDVSADLGLI
jgi:ribosomal protein L23